MAPKVAGIGSMPEPQQRQKAVARAERAGRHSGYLPTPGLDHASIFPTAHAHLSGVVGIGPLPTARQRSNASPTSP
jgi:hypothetical protein